MNTHRFILPVLCALAVSTAGAFADDAGRIRVGPDTTPGDASYLYKITHPGSYYLGANILGAVNKSAIFIASGGVTLDLNGFSVVGAGAASASGKGIYINTFDGPVRVTNGSVRNWKSHGIETQSAPLELDSVRLSDNGGSGLVAVGASVVVTRCIAEENDGIGFDLFAIGMGSQISNSVARRNGASGFKGGAVRECSSHANDDHGFEVPTSIESSTADANGRHGILVDSRARVVGNTSTNNGSKSSDGSGIYVTGHGSLINANECSANKRGMSVYGSRNRIDENHFTDNQTIGLFVFGQTNIIIRNTARNLNAVNWSIAAHNRGGRFVAPPQTATVNGATGGPGSGTEDPFANLSF